MSFIQVANRKVYYNAPFGLPSQGDRKIMLLVHGAGGSSRHWEPMLAQFDATEFPVALDLPGHGASEGYVPDSIDAVVEFLNVFLNRLGIEHPICYVGQSMGGLIGLQFALAYPDRVAQLVLMATSARIQLHPDFLQQAITGQWNYETLRQSFAAEIPKNVKDLVLSEFQYTLLQADASDFMGVSRVDLSSAVSALRLPTLILTGDDDVIISPRKSKMLQWQIENSRLVTIPNAGHYLHVEQPAKVAAEIQHFVKGDRLVSASQSQES
ncbi:alpha/beta hydrolase [Gloeocapsopsis crepidinum LEGE 06123]|uniref:Alpha/beta hydrolase n=1 Tax=Gloeocapsopsis crepidinum LEGE 06123 TaxID=588587 RepID=A0ABR9UVQ9_9CHRO|nr:alpha/beta hydrolase [Gloeocapsopsis crepidinum]MBE9192364.1 alpha/beta hydrolase [Gloeocapsopsis crepidinum LEGE 06123]